MKRVLCGLLAIMPPLILGLIIWRYGVNIPFGDQWDALGKLFLAAAEDRVTWSQLMEQHNETRILFPNLLFLALAKLTNWNTKAEMLATFVLACLVSLSIYCLSRITLKSYWGHPICFLLANLLIFHPIQYENWLWGFQVINFVPIAAITISLAFIFASVPWSIKLLASSIVSIIATFSFSNGVLCWIIIFPALVSKSIQDKVNKTWVIFVWLAIATTSMTFYLYNYHRLPVTITTDEILARPALVVEYYLALLGAPLFPHSVSNSQIAGGAILFTFVGFCLYFWQQRRNIWLINWFLPWLSIGFYVLLSAGFITIGRIGLGIGTSLSSRYITCTSYLLIALIYLFGISLSCVRRKVVLKTIIFLLTGLFLITYRDNFNTGIKLAAHSHYARVYGKACLLTADLIEDEECISLHLYPLPDNLVVPVQKLKDIYEVGLLSPTIVSQIDWQDKDRQQIDEKSRYGKLERFSTDEDGTYAASGWIFALPSKPSLDAVILAYQLPNRPRTPFAIASLNVEDKDRWGLLLNPRHVKLNWQESLPAEELPPPRSQITAWAFDTNNGKAYPLQGAASL